MILTHHRPQDLGYVCMPLKSNVLTPRPDWILKKCPKCGELCWESELARMTLKHGNKAAVCTMCALILSHNIRRSK